MKCSDPIVHIMPSLSGALSSRINLRAATLTASERFRTLLQLRPQEVPKIRRRIVLIRVAYRGGIATFGFGRGRDRTWSRRSSSESP
jgi:hypothetical protein